MGSDIFVILASCFSGYVNPIYMLKKKNTSKDECAGIVAKKPLIFMIKFNGHVASLTSDAYGVYM